MINFDDSYEKQVSDCEKIITEHGIESFISSWTPDAVGQAVMNYIEKIDGRKHVEPVEDFFKKDSRFKFKTYDQLVEEGIVPSKEERDSWYSGGLR